MKKSLFALAALTAIAGAAQAQSSVTLYGTLDAGLYYGNKVGGDAQSSSAATVKPAAAPGQDINVAYVDGSIASSIWGSKGSEDLGGGLKGTFQAESDLITNNGGLKNAGLFGRAANVGLDSSKYGALALGLKMNPLIATHAGLMPVAGNSVSTNLAGTYSSYADFFTRNAVTYTSPVWAGFQAVAQVGLGNTVGDNGGGNVYAASAAYTGINNLKVTAAWQNRVKASSASAANYSPQAGTAVLFSDTNTVGKTTYVAGAQYKLGAFTLAYGYAHNATDTTVLGNGPKVHANQQLGVGYQATPKLLLGATYAVGTADWSLANVQARYSLSPRTTAYAQAGFAMNGAYAAVVPVASQSNIMPAPNVTNYGAAKNTTQSAIGVGVIHTF